MNRNLQGTLIIWGITLGMALFLMLLAMFSDVVSEISAAQDNQYVKDEIVRVFGKDSPTALKVAFCESSYRPNAQNGSSTGVFQIHIKAHKVKREDMVDYQKNIAKAYEIYTKQGWRPWKWSAKCWQNK